MLLQASPGSCGVLCPPGGCSAVEVSPTLLLLPTPFALDEVNTVGCFASGCCFHLVLTSGTVARKLVSLQQYGACFATRTVTGVVSRGTVGSRQGENSSHLQNIQLYLPHPMQTVWGAVCR